ncbi:helix-turn-helix transcriptional regulator [Nocardiopsis rhodophaea]|uniref:helix-turn-helix transcriptional regulator n=1 Tax=Nocardiopsis rhodophaea TaxID=280238 RepID=UPI0031CFFB43
MVATGVEGRLPPGILMSDAPSSAVHRIRLDPLPPQAISQVAEDLLGSPPTARLISLLRRAQGHPTLTVKLLEGMTEEGRVFLRDSKADLENKRIPNRVHIWLEDVLRRGPEPMLRFMTACAFTGQKVTSLERIGAILGTSRDELHRIVESAYRMGFIEGREELKFQSPIMHELFWGYIPSFFPELLQGSTNPAPYPGTSHHRQPFSPRLTLQEMRLILLTSEGYTNQQIARRLAISQHTVNYHLKKLFRKYEVNSRVRLVAAALKDTSPLADYQWPH